MNNMLQRVESAIFCNKSHRHEYCTVPVNSHGGVAGHEGQSGVFQMSDVIRVGARRFPTYKLRDVPITASLGHDHVHVRVTNGQEVRPQSTDSVLGNIRHSLRNHETKCKEDENASDADYHWWNPRTVTPKEIASFHAVVARL